MTPTRRRFLQQGAAAGAALAWPSWARAQAPGGRARPNVVVLMLDALRPDYTQAYGATRATSPWLGAFAEQAAVFDRCWSTSTWTAPACASLFTGLYPTEHGIVEGLMAHQRRTERQEEKGVLDAAPTGVDVNAFAPDMVLLPQYFREAGYRCFGAATNPNIGPEIGFERGFERAILRDEGTAEELAQWIEPWREELTEGAEPYFLYLHTMDVHKPYHRRAPWYQPAEDGARDRFAEAAEAYRSELRYMDEHLAALERAWGWDEDTVVVVVSDHGEEFGEHGGIGHGFQMHAELNRILLMVRGPGVAARRIATPVGIHDVLPTLLDLLELGEPVESTGASLKPLLMQPGEVASVPAEAGAAPDGAVPASLRGRLLYAHRRKSKFRPLDIWAVNYERWRLVRGEEGNVHLFDIEADPLEQRPLPGSEHPEIRTQLVDAMNGFIRAGIADRTIRRRIDQTAEERAALERLGYADGPTEADAPAGTDGSTEADGQAPTDPSSGEDADGR